MKIEALKIHRTYGGVLEGVPTREGNSAMVEQMLASFAAANYIAQNEIAVIPPIRTPVIWPAHTSETTRRLYPNPESLPEYACEAVLIDGLRVAYLLFFIADLTVNIPKTIAEMLQIRDLPWDVISKEYEP